MRLSGTRDRRPMAEPVINPSTSDNPSNTQSTSARVSDERFDVVGCRMAAVQARAIAAPMSPPNLDTQVTSTSGSFQPRQYIEVHHQHASRGEPGRLAAHGHRFVMRQ